jgi:hypothetical protein
MIRSPSLATGPKSGSLGPIRHELPSADTQFLSNPPEARPPEPAKGKPIDSWAGDSTLARDQCFPSAENQAAALSSFDGPPESRIATVYASHGHGGTESFDVGGCGLTT